MSGAVISSNTTIKVSAAVSATSTGTGTTLYTCAASSYAIVNIGIKDTGGAGTTVTISVDGKEIHQSALGATTTRLLQGIYVGPSQAVSFSAGASTTVTVTGVEFINSP